MRSCGGYRVVLCVDGGDVTAVDALLLVYCLCEVVPGAYAFVGKMIDSGHNAAVDDLHDSACEVACVGG